MATEILVPTLGESVSSATVGGREMESRSKFAPVAVFAATTKGTIVSPALVRNRTVAAPRGEGVV